MLITEGKWLAELQILIVLKNSNLADLWIHTWLISLLSLLVSGTVAWWEWYPHYGLRVQEQGPLIISSRLQLLHLKIC